MLLWLIFYPNQPFQKTLYKTAICLLPCVQFFIQKNIPYLPVISCPSSNLSEIFRLLLIKYPLNHFGRNRKTLTSAESECRPRFPGGCARHQFIVLQTTKYEFYVNFFRISWPKKLTKTGFNPFIKDADLQD